MIVGGRDLALKGHDCICEKHLFLCILYSTCLAITPFQAFSNHDNSGNVKLILQYDQVIQE